VYLGSFAALGALVFLTRLRSIEGIRAAGFSAITVLVGVGLLSVLFWPILSGIDKNLDSSKDDALQVTLKTVSVLPSCLSVEKKFLQEAQEERLVVENLCEEALVLSLVEGERTDEQSTWSVASRQTMSMAVDSASPQTQSYEWLFPENKKKGQVELRFVRPDIRPTNAASASGLWFLAHHPGGKGWIVGDIYAPPMAHWVVFLLFGFAGLVRSKHNPLSNASWVIALGGLYLLLSIHSGVMRPWYDSPIGEVVRFPRRYMVGVSLCFSVAAGLGFAHLLRWPKVELGLGVLLGAYLAWWGAVAGGLGQAYPLTPLPERPEFAAWIAKDGADAAVLLVPQQLPQESGNNKDPNAAPSENRRECLPVFAQLGAMDKLFPCQSERSHIASSDQVWLQTQYEKASWYAPSLVTLVNRSTDVNLEKNLTDLARGKLGYFDGKNDFEDPWRFAESESYAADMAWLKGAGLKYVAVDVARYRPQELSQIDKVLSPYAVEVEPGQKYKDFEDGTGVRVYRLYDKKPKGQAAPKKTFQDAAGAGFSGRVVGVVDKVQGVLSLRVQSAGQSADCFIRPEDGTFHCGDVGEVETVYLRINQSTFSTQMTQNKDGSWDIKPMKVIPQ